MGKKGDCGLFTSAPAVLAPGTSLLSRSHSFFLISYIRMYILILKKHFNRYFRSYHKKINNVQRSRESGEDSGEGLQSAAVALM